MMVSTKSGIIGHTETRPTATATFVRDAGFALLVSAGSIGAFTGVAATSTSAPATRPELSSASIGDDDVELRERDLLQSVIRDDAELAVLLNEAIRQLRAAFGDTATIAIEPFVDPEASDADIQVFVVAVTHLTFEEADELLESVVNGWWAANQHRANYRVSLATEFV